MLDVASFTPQHQPASCVRPSAVVPPHVSTGRNRGGAEDSGAVSLAETLARQFPSARIIIGAPDEQQQARGAHAAHGGEDRLEVQMKRLKELLEEDKGRHWQM